MKTLIILIATLLTGTGCTQNTGFFDPARHTFMDDSRGSAAAVVLTPTQASNLVVLIQSAKSDRTPATSQVDLKAPRPQLAPSLCVDIYADSTRQKFVGQILGYERKWIFTRGKVVSDTNTVNAVYRAIGR